MNKLIRITTVPVSLAGLIRGQHRYMTQQGFEVVGVSSSGKEALKNKYNFSSTNMRDFADEYVKN